VLIEYRLLGGSPCEAAIRVREGFLDHFNECSKWETPYFDPKWNGLRYNLARNFLTSPPAIAPRTEKKHEACSILGAFREASWRRERGEAELWSSLDAAQPARFAIVFAEDERLVEAVLRDAREKWAEWYDEQMRRYRCLAARAPVLETGPEKELGEVVRTAPLFVHSTRRERSREEIAFRASTRGYGVWNAWDGQWACSLLSACGDAETARRFLAFLNASRGPNGAVTMSLDYDWGPLHDQNLNHPLIDRPLGAGWNVMHDCWAVENLHEYFFRNGDRETLAAGWPATARALRTIRGNAGSRGLVESCFGGADYSVQCGRPQSPDPCDNRTISSRLSGVEDHALLFHACQLGAELACAAGDRETLAACRELGALLEQNFMPVFFNPENGFFLDCVWPKDNPVHRNPLVRLTALMAMVGYAELLSMGEWQRLADFVVRRLSHPEIGLCEMPLDQPVPERAASRRETWLQNSFRDIFKLARLSGNRDLMETMIATVARYFGEEKVVKETIANIHSPFFKISKFPTHVSSWQCMSASAWWFGIMESVVGLRLTRGQLEYIPGDAGRDARVKNLPFGRCVWDVQVTGRGRWVRRLMVNGQEQKGNYQLLPSGEAQMQTALIEKTDRPPETPVILSAGASRIAVREAGRSGLKARLTGPGVARLWFYSPSRPGLFVNGREADLRWTDCMNLGTACIDGSEADVAIRL